MPTSPPHRVRVTGSRPRTRLLIFGRLPEPGRAKTRLEPALGPEAAAELYGAFLDDAVGWGRTVAPAELWVPERPGVEEALGRRYPGCAVRIQSEGDLGRRLEGAFAAAFDEAVDHAVAVGSDHPTLPAELLGRAFRALKGAHLVLGPSEDGGYYAIGLRRYAWPGAAGLFDGAPWSRPELLDWTRERARELDLCHVELPVWYDVDRPSDLERMQTDLIDGSATAAAWDRLSPAAVETRERE